MFNFSNSNSFDPKGERLIASYPYWFRPNGVNPRVHGI